MRSLDKLYYPLAWLCISTASLADGQSAFETCSGWTSPRALRPFLRTAYISYILVLAHSKLLMFMGVRRCTADRDQTHPICVNLDTQRANANSSSSPEKSEEDPTSSAERPRSSMTVDQYSVSVRVFEHHSLLRICASYPSFLPDLSLNTCCIGTSDEANSFVRFS
jgi:hypothetical protein